MGCDGGTIPKRFELVKTKAKKEEKDTHSTLVARWFFCAASNQPLSEPVAADRWGRLYNREALLAAILAKSIPRVTAFKRHSTLLTLTPNPLASASAQQDTFADPNKVQSFVPKWICPVTLREMNGKNAFSYLTTCGCVFSDIAFKNIPNKDTCLVCSTPFSTEDHLVPINPPETGPQMDMLTARADRLDTEAKAAAKARKRKKNDSAADADSKPSVADAKPSVADDSVKRARKDEPVSVVESSVAATTSILLAKIQENKVLKAAELRDEREELAGVKELYAPEREGEEKVRSNWLSSMSFTRYSTY